MKLEVKSCQPPVREPYLRVTPHTALPATKYKFLGFFTLLFLWALRRANLPRGSIPNPCLSLSLKLAL